MNRLVGLLSIFSVIFFLNTTSAQSLTKHAVPADLENIKAIKLSSDKHASNFLIFIKKSVANHKHLKHTENIYVISGKGQFRLGDKISEIKAGDYLHIPQGEIHGVIVTSAEPLKVLSIQSPEFFGDDRVFVD